MKKWKISLSLGVFVILFFTVLSVRAQQTDQEELTARKKKAEQLALDAWMDEEWYLEEAFFEGKSDAELSEGQLDGLIRTMTEEELQVYVERLNAGISPYVVTRYQKVSQVNPSTGNLLYTGVFEVDGKLAFCIERSVATPAKGSVTGNKSLVTNEKLRKVLYYGYNGPKNQGYTYVETALAAGEANGDGDNALGRSVLAEIQKMETPPSTFQVWKVDTNGGKTQDLAFYTLEEKGKGIVKKVSADVAFTEGNAAYSLEGAVYGIYEDEACTTLCKNVTTDATGMTEAVELEKKTYYLKEIKAPMGFLKSAKVESFVIKSGETTVVTVQETPKRIEPKLLIEKVDAETGKNIPQGSGSLQGAQFEMSYYPNVYQSEEEIAMAKTAPLKKWLLQTGADGTVWLDEAHWVSGDAIWQNFPLGTLTIQEKKASNGYHLNPKMFVVPLRAGDVEVPAIKVMESCIKLELIKYRKDTKEVLAGAQFEHICPNGSSKPYTTDHDGRICLTGLERGKHKLREVQPPEGYPQSKQMIELEFFITEENKIEITKKTDEIKATILKDGNLKVEVENESGYQLPKTGTMELICLQTVGSICFIKVWKGKKSI